MNILNFFKKKKQTSFLNPKARSEIGTGFLLPSDLRSRKVYQLPRKILLEDINRKGHLWGFGTTGVGKTRVIENMITQDIRKGYSVVTIDPKNDTDLFSKVVEVARETGRVDELMFISTVFPQYSITLDPLAHYYIPEELVAHIVSGIQIGKEPFFYNVSLELSTAIVGALIMTDVAQRKRPFNLTDVKNYVSKDQLKLLSRRLQNIDTPEARQLFEDLKKIADSPADYYSKVSSSLRVALMELTSGNIGKIVGQGHQNRFIERLESGKRVILHIQLGSLMTHQAAYTLGKVIVSMIKSFSGRVYSSGRMIDPPLCLYIDEAQNILFRGIEDLFAKSGSIRVWVHGFCQSVAQIYEAIGRDAGNAILDNTNTKLFMRVTDTNTADYAAGHFGLMRGYAGVFGGDGGVTVREDEVERIRSQEFLNFANREFAMITYSGLYRGNTAFVSPPKRKVLYPEVKAAQLGGE